MALASGLTWLQHFQSSFRSFKKPEAPIRAELFSIERLEQHAHSLAEAQRAVARRARGRPLLPRVKDNAYMLRTGHGRIVQTVQAERPITPAAEWLIDNFYIVEDQVREIIDDLPPGFYRELPKLTEGHLAGYPRVLGVAWAFVAHTDSRFDPDWLTRFVQAYQQTDALEIGEVWALAISLRILLVENLRRLTEQIIFSQAACQEADALSDRLLNLKNADSPPEDAAFPSLEDVELSRPFAVQLVQRLRDQEGRAAPALQWLNQRLADQGTTAEEIVHLEHQEQTTMNTSVRNIITSMRLLSAMDWAGFFEDVSVVDTILRSESRFAENDFPTRDLYRHAIETLSRGCRVPETEVARRAAKKARGAPDGPQSDPGYYLISRGRSAFEAELQLHLSLRHLVLRFCMAHATAVYLGSLLILTSVFLSIPLSESLHAGMSLRAWLAFGFLGLIPASEMAVAIVNGLVTNSLRPDVLPKLDFASGVPNSARTLVVIPTLLVRPSDVEAHLERLEIHYLSNPDGHLQFALLTDWTDAAQEQMPDDAALLAAARKGIHRLNERYPPALDKEPRFFLFHRRRLWNPGEGVWMGWERKRGKLHELNRLLRGSTETSFVNAEQVPSAIRFIITLDGDTQMPRGAAYRLAGAMAHPLNRPRLDLGRRRVVEGYGVMQPRITPALPMAGFGSLYQQIYSGPAGMDPYAFAVSDVYQDLFMEGSYVGKGIYDLDIFEAALAGRVPDNSMLSHDLFEGLYARAALLSDVELFEEFPAHYQVAVARTHRWVRGDWQLLRWIFRSDLPLIDQWKMIDNLRRSLLVPSAILALLGAWTVRDTPSGVWTAFILATIGLPPLLPILIHLMPRRRQNSFLNYWRGLVADLQLAGTQIFMSVVFMAHQAWVMTEAISRTLYRMLLSHRHLLEWTTASRSRKLYDGKLSTAYRRMIGGPMLALTAVLLTLVFGTQRFEWAISPFLLLWILSPWIAHRLSLPLTHDAVERLRPHDRPYLRGIARKTWRLFETIVTSSDHALPPDNVQEIPQPRVAQRTSPTNIGLYLLSINCAYEFGWLGFHDMIERLEATLATVQKLERHEGHLFNWYDTRDLRPLASLYVSTVDSGNLAGHLWTLANACRKLTAKPINEDNSILGLLDVLELVQQASDQASGGHRTETVTRAQWEEALADLRGDLETPPSAEHWGPFLDGLATKAGTLVDMARTLAGPGAQSGAVSEVPPEIVFWSERLLLQIRSHARDLADAPLFVERNRRLTNLARQCDQLVREMRFGFLCDPVKKIFSIGYQVSEQRLDASYYDLLASEARLASFVAIAKGDVPALHWFHLSRALIPVGRGAALMSWSGSMFEYLMPSLVMQPPFDSLLDQTCRRIVRRQIDYGTERGVPWGVSESGYNAQDLEYTYQYKNFGVPGLGLKRGLADDLLIAPYATALAAMVDPVAASDNFARLAQAGAEGPCGFYEALDYTTARLPEDQKVAVVREYMAHHQGMTLVALANVLYSGVMKRNFHADPRVQATELLLQERTPRDVPLARVRLNENSTEVRSMLPLVLRRFYTAHEETPRTHLLSNGSYGVMITAAGSGYSRWRDLAVTRWREDVTRDGWGTYCFLRDVETGQVWSAGYQPTGVPPDSYEVDFSEDRAEIVRRDGALVTTLEVVVSPEDDSEMRRITLKHSGPEPREIEVTSYAEVVLVTPAADQAHPAFSNLFVETEFVAAVNGLIATRRLRSAGESPVWMSHVVVVEGETVGEVEFESDRARFLARGHNIRAPLSMMDGKPLSNTTGAVLDPIVSLRRRIRLEPGKTARITFTTSVAESREAVLGLADKYHDPAMFERTVTLAWTHAHIQQHHLGIQPSEAHLFQDLAGRILYSNAGLRPARGILERNTRGAPGLWAFGISGDLPIVLVRIDEEDDRDIVREILRAHEYWRLKNLAVDLVILNEKGVSYAQELQRMLEDLVRDNQAMLKQKVHATHGDIFVLQANRLSPEDHILLRSAARITLLSRQGTLAQQMERLEASGEDSDDRESLKDSRRTPDVWRSLLHLPFAKEEGPAATAPPPANLQFFNGLGGFSEDGREYVTMLGPGQSTPAPWINVIGTPLFGFQVSESGAGYTWSMNSRENQLTPWSNDPVSDPPSEALYIADDDTGELWTPTALPIRVAGAGYASHHGQGYSRFEHASHGVESELQQFVPLGESAKVSRLRLKNTTRRTLRLSVTAYAEWALGTSRAASAPFIVSSADVRTRALFARNPWNAEFAERIAFADLGGAQESWTADRTEFIGRNGTLAHPAALGGEAGLSGSTGPGLDPCAALQTKLSLRPGATVDVVFYLGQSENPAAAGDAVVRLRKMNIDSALEDVHRHWSNTLEAVQVRTPDTAMDLMLNRWWLYQTLSCRLWARAAFYQAGGAYGFRDQLQDILALVVSRRDLAREHLLRAAARQFPEGDVQHWWHPPTGRGVRTHISDDLLWLPYAVAHYLEVTGDAAVLDERVGFLEGQPVAEGKEDAYFQPGPSTESASLFEHCARALDARLPVGSHGLPLMGSGDWNDGMNRVGAEGKGESVWLTWFLHSTLWEFSKLADSRGETERAEKWRLHVNELKTAVERHGWDGDWYRRAYFDDGAPLGSSVNKECRIDSIAQSWAVISGAADPARAVRAMAALDQQLNHRADQLSLLFTPPFDASQPSPGYIQGYPPGVRENGGQYTHAAAWAVLAFAALGDGDKAEEIFSMLNPIKHSSTRAHRYKVEPYVSAGDVYSEAPHTGRGGWTWYTGSAAWLYRGGLEWILGFRLRGTSVFMDPCIPKRWPGFELSFRYHSARYDVKVENPNHVSRGVHGIELDGKPARSGAPIPLTDDGKTHIIRIALGAAGGTAQA